VPIVGADIVELNRERSGGLTARVAAKLVKRWRTGYLVITLPA
jgi:arginase family enzyme